MGIVMPTESERRLERRNRILTLIAGFSFVLQFLLFMYSYNFLGITILTLIGWVLLIPGFLLISLSETTLKKNPSTDTLIEAKRVDNLLRHSFSIGWMMMSVALALISQYWLSIFFMGIQLPLIMFNIYSVEGTNVKE
ncbi:MAG: hypothetical protein ACXAC0_10315 [Candidatus Thorarchaeota archaeon]